MQLELPGLLPTARRPLLPVEAVVFMVNRNSQEIAQDCERGHFRFAFDISSPQSARRELRILLASVLRELDAARSEPGTFDEMFDAIFPRRGLRSTELQRTLACSLAHIRELDEAQLIRVERERGATSGPNSSRVYSRASLRDFLAARSLGSEGRH